MGKYNPNHLAYTFLLTVVVLFSSSFLFSGKPLLGFDYLVYFLPNRAFLKQELLKNYLLPLWNPYLFSGTPFLANPQTAFFYPFTWLFLVLDVKMAYGYLIGIHLVLASMFMYYLGRTIGLQPKGSLVAGLIFTFGGLPQAHILAGHLTFWQAYVWLPLMVAFYLKGYQKNCSKYFWATGLAIGLQLLAGFPQLSFYSLMTLMLLGIYLGFSERKGSQLDLVTMEITLNQSAISASSVVAGLRARSRAARDGRPYGFGTLFSSLVVPFVKRVFNKKFLWRLIHPALPIALGLGLAAVQLLPSLQFASLSTRSYGVSYDFSTSDSLPPYYLLTAFMPTFFGTALDGNYWGGEGDWQFWEFSQYIGIFPLLFLLFLKLKRRYTVFFLALALFSLFFALGKYNPFYRFIYYLPGFHNFRLPAQILYLFTFALALLAGSGMEDFFDNFGRVSNRLIIVSSIVGLLLVAVLIFKIYDVQVFRFIISFFIHKILSYQEHLVLAKRYSFAWQGFLFFTLISALSVSILILTKFGLLSKKVVFPIIFLTLIMDLWGFAFKVIKTQEYHLKDQNSSPLLEYLNNENKGYRILDLAGFFLPNEELNLKIQTVEGYDPLFLKRYLEYLNKTLGNPEDQQLVNLTNLRPPNSNLINMFNVKSIIVPNEEKEGLVGILSGKESIVRTDALSLYDNPESMPKAFVVPKIKLMPPAAILESIAEGSVNFTQEGLVEEKYAYLFAADFKGLTGTATIRDSSRVKPEILSYQPNSISLRVNTDLPSILVLSDNYYPAWRATVNGKRSEVFPINYLFRGVLLPSGSSEINFFYSPWLFQVGGLISLGLLGIALIVILRKDDKPVRVHRRARRERRE